jgi:transcriptional regulator with XRE-family HTH domain
LTKSIFTAQYDRLCALLIQARIDAGFSQAQLAKCLNRPQSFVSKYETKQRRLDVVEFLEVAHCMKANGPELLRKLAGVEEDGDAASLMIKSEKRAPKTNGDGKINGNGKLSGSGKLKPKR